MRQITKATGKAIGGGASRAAVPAPHNAAKAATGQPKGRRAVPCPAMWTHGKAKRKGV
jgi:hypothetical protein